MHPKGGACPVSNSSIKKIAEPFGNLLHCKISGTHTFLRCHILEKDRGRNP